MKSLLRNIVLLSSILLTLSACKKDKKMVVAKSNAAPTVLTATYESLILTEETAPANAIIFKWSKADFGFSAAITYAIEVGKKDSSFINSKSISIGNEQEQTLTVGVFNTLLNQLKLVGFVANDVEVRVRADIGGGAAPVFSNVIPLVVTPYLDKPAFELLYLVGDATVGKWDNTKATPVFRDPENVFAFTFTGNFDAGEFKFISAPGKGEPSWGLDGSGAVMYREKETDPAVSNIPVATAGYYKITLNLKNNTFIKTPFDASAAPIYESIGIIGVFSNWENVIPMANTTLNPHIWTIDHTFAADTEMKFRIASGWEVNWGADSQGVAGEPYGIARSGAVNFRVEAGSYIIMFNDITAEYVIIKK